MNLAVNLILNQNVAKEREENKYICDNCHRVYYRDQVVHADKGINISGYFPENGVCSDVRLMN